MTALATQIDTIEEKIVRLLENGGKVAEIRSSHTFTPGLYVRGCFIPAGTLLVSEIHKTEHPFVITEGIVRVWSENEGCQVYEAPFHGVTKPGTRRVLYTETDTVWTTYHPTNKTDVEEIAEEILDKRENPLLGDHPMIHQWLSQIPKNLEQ